MNEQWRKLITIEPGKRGGRPCIRSMRITVYDILSYLAAGMTVAEILDDFPYLTYVSLRVSRLLNGVVRPSPFRVRFLLAGVMSVRILGGESNRHSRGFRQ